MGAERSQWQFPPNEVGKVIGWSDEASPSNPNASKGLVNKGPFISNANISADPDMSVDGDKIPTRDAVKEYVDAGDMFVSEAPDALPRPNLHKHRDIVGALDLMSAGGLDEAVKNREVTSADADEITPLVQEIATYCADNARSLYVPSGLYYLDTQIAVGAPLSLIGAGAGDTALRWTSGAASEGLLVTLDTNSYKQTTIQNVSLYTEKAHVGTAVTIDGTGQVSGGNIQDRTRPRLKMHNVTIEGSGTPTATGWNGGIDLTSTLSVVLDALSICGHRSGSTGDPADSAFGVKFHGAGQPVQLVLSKSFIRCFQDALISEDAEGVYVFGNEFTSVNRGFHVNNAVLEPAFTFHSNHVAAVEECGRLTNTLQAAVFNNYLYAQATGAGPVDLLTVEGSDNTKIYDNFFGNPGATVTTRGVIVKSGSSTTEIRNNNFSHGIGADNIVIESGANATRVYKNYGRQGSIKVTDAGTGSLFEELRGYVGDLNSITTNDRFPEQLHILETGATNTPPSIGTITGAVVKTWGRDQNNAVQTLQVPSSQSGFWLRRKSGGTWSGWFKLTGVADV